MGIIKILLEEPEKIQTLIINLIKLVLTILIAHALFPYPELMSLGSIDKVQLDLPLEKTLFFIIAIVSIWFIIWSIVFGLFVAIISFWRKSNKESKSRSIQRKDLKDILKFGKIYTETKKGFIRPTRHIAIVAEIGEVIKENHSFNLSSTAFAHWLYIATVIWVYFIFKLEINCSNLIWVVVSGISIIVAIRIWRVVERIFEAFKDNSLEIHNFLQVLLFRKIVIDTLENNFVGKLNEEETGYMIKLGPAKFEVRDFAYFNSEIGNITLFHMLQKGRNNFNGEQIIVSNIEPDERLKSLIETLKIKAFIQATTEEELIVRLVKLMSVLEYNSEKENN